ncbi:FUSC family protein [Clostridium paraputrificum]|uniref:FUSC family protein n=1 Tax=Clostridium paraputrificum TaxID=29363 RepID=UPI003D339C9F
MDRKIILSKTTLYIKTIVFIIAFKMIFGTENTLIGVTTITAMMMFLEKDFTLNPVKYTIKLTVFNVALGCIAFIANTNMYIAIPLNFITIFVIGFTMCYNLKSPSYLPFTLQYLFMLATPIPIEKLPMRLLSLVAGAIAIMVMQLVANRNRVSKYGNVILSGVCTSLLNKIRLIRDGGDYSEINEGINKSIAQFRKIIYDKREDNFYLTEESRIKLNLSVALNKINYLLNEINSPNELLEIEEDLILTIDNLKICFEDESNLEKLDLLFSELFDKYEENNTNNLLILKILNTSSFLKDNLYELNKLDKKHYDLVNRVHDVPYKFKKLSVYKNNLRVNSLRFSYAFRVATGIAIGGFIMDFFHLTEGRWILYTINALSQPQYELSKQKSKDRIFATIIGAIIVAILFAIIKDTTARTLIMMASGYIGSYTKEYKHNMICITVSAVGSAALLGNTNVLSINRILLVILGAIITILLSKFVFPYKAKDANEDLVRMYKDIVVSMLKEIESLIKGNKSGDEMKNLIIVSSLIEDKLITNNSNKENEQLNSYLEEQRLLVMNLYDLYQWISINHIEETNAKNIINDIREVTKLQGNMTETEIQKIVTQLKDTHGIKDKVLLSNVIEIILGIKRVENIKLMSRA